MMSAIRYALPALAAVLAGLGPAGAQTPAPARSITVPLEQRNGSGVHGQVNITPQGSGSAIHIQVVPPGTANGMPTLRSGADCIAAGGKMNTLVPLNPISGGTSRTVVAIPFSAFQSRHFVVDVRSATAAAQAAQACARI